MKGAFVALITRLLQRVAPSYKQQTGNSLDASRTLDVHELISFSNANKERPFPAVINKIIRDYRSISESRAIIKNP